jgi:hypothetical protein
MAKQRSSAAGSKQPKAVAAKRTAKPAAQRRVADALPSAGAPKRAKPSPAQDKLDAAGGAAIAQLIIEGQTYRQIAEKYGVGLGSLAEWIEADPERSHACARAREMAAQTFDEMAEQRIDEAADPFALAKAKELAVHFRWRAKAANPKRYGDKVQLDAKVDTKSISDDELLKQLAKFGIQASVKPVAEGEGA